jgi:hypothetical protein
VRIGWLQARFINHLRLPGGIGRAGSKAAFHWVSWWCCAGLYNLITVSTVSANVLKGQSVCVRAINLGVNAQAIERRHGVFKSFSFNGISWPTLLKGASRGSDSK